MIFNNNIGENINNNGYYGGYHQLGFTDEPLGMRKSGEDVVRPGVILKAPFIAENLYQGMAVKVSIVGTRQNGILNDCLPILKKKTNHPMPRLIRTLSC